MNAKAYKTKEEVLERGREAIGKTIGEIDTTGRINTGKGAIGSIIEEGWFGYKINSDAASDFPEAGVELKATPYRRTKTDLISAKERLVCNIIDYMTEHQKTFETSSFWEKNETILMMSYEHRDDLPKSEFTIDKVTLFNYPDPDRSIIEQDWEKIIGKIRAGKAHELSEGDTLYLGACTKGASSKTLREQPFSEIRAKQRAYSLKQSYMTYLLRTYIFGGEQDEHIIQDPSILSKKSFEEIIFEKLKPFMGKSQDSLLEQFDLKSHKRDKHINETLLGKMLGIKGKISKSAEFQKANIQPKTIRVEKNGRIIESMSFPTMDFNEVVSTDWDDSDFKDQLEQTRFMFIIFRRNNIEELIFDDIMFWSIPEDDLEQMGVVWEKTAKTLNKGVRLERIKGYTYNDLPKIKDNTVAHVRPHTSKSYYELNDGTTWGSGTRANAQQLPDGRWMTKQCFWLTNHYVKSQIENIIKSRERN